jgi:hypothetical protein
VKVIKKEDRAAVQQPKVKPELNSKKAAAREVVSTVADWVNDFQRRKREETQESIRKFFTTPQPNEM